MNSLTSSWRAIVTPRLPIFPQLLALLIFLICIYLILLPVLTSPLCFPSSTYRSTNYSIYTFFRSTITMADQPQAPKDLLSQPRSEETQQILAAPIVKPYDPNDFGDGFTDSRRMAPKLPEFNGSLDKLAGGLKLSTKEDVEKWIASNLFNPYFQMYLKECVYPKRKESGVNKTATGANYNQIKDAIKMGGPVASKNTQTCSPISQASKSSITKPSSCFIALKPTSLTCTESCDQTEDSRMIPPCGQSGRLFDGR